MTACNVNKLLGECYLNVSKYCKPPIAMNDKAKNAQ